MDKEREQARETERKRWEDDKHNSGGKRRLQCLHKNTHTNHRTHVPFCMHTHKPCFYLFACYMELTNVAKFSWEGVASIMVFVCGCIFVTYWGHFLTLWGPTVLMWTEDWC